MRKQFEVDHNEVVGSDSISSYIQKIKEAISKNKPDTLQDLLSHTHILVKQKFKVRRVLGGVQDIPCIYEEQPVVEKLFFENQNDFLDIVATILKAENQALYYAFTNSLTKTNMKEEDLFCWNPSSRPALIESIKKMEQYGNKLKEEDIVVGTAVVSLAEQLDKKLTADEYKIENKDKVQVLKAKLEFTALLNSQNHLLPQDKKWKAIIFNVFTHVFTLGLANVLNLCVTGNWFFFNKTDTEKCIDQANKLINLPSQ